MSRFNPPPGWPTPPPDWLPDPNWAPDPSWPPAPPGWRLILPPHSAVRLEGALPTCRTGRPAPEAALEPERLAPQRLTLSAPPEEACGTPAPTGDAHRTGRTRRGLILGGAVGLVSLTGLVLAWGAGGLTDVPLWPRNSGPEARSVQAGAAPYLGQSRTTPPSPTATRAGRTADTVRENSTATATGRLRSADVAAPTYVTPLPLLDALTVRRAPDTNGADTNGADDNGAGDNAPDGNGAGQDRPPTFADPDTARDEHDCPLLDGVLRRDLLSLETEPGTDRCRVLRGNLRDPYTGREVRYVATGPGGSAASGVRLDHVIGEADAWRSGADHWTPARRRAFALDPVNLVVTPTDTPGRRGSSDTRLPLPPASRCSYAARRVSLKSAYGLSVSPTERAVLRAVLTSCPTRVAIPGEHLPGPDPVLPNGPAGDRATVERGGSGRPGRGGAGRGPGVVRRQGR